MQTINKSPETQDSLTNQEYIPFDLIVTKKRLWRRKYERRIRKLDKHIARLTQYEYERRELLNQYEWECKKLTALIVL